jgi:hypothetical protein
MRFAASVAALAGLFLASPQAHADPPAAPVEQGSPPAPAPEEEGPHVGFAMSFAAGIAVPLGNGSGAPGDSLSASFGTQVPFTLQLGANVTRSLFVGVYGTFAPGAAGSAMAACRQSGVNCTVGSRHVGLTAEYRFRPGETFEPWVGLGAGYEWDSVDLSTAAAIGVDGPEVLGNASVSGWELLHLKLGLDLLAISQVAAGPFVDVGFGRFTHAHQDGTNVQTQDYDISPTSLHEWATFGVRGVFMP